MRTLETTAALVLLATTAAVGLVRTQNTAATSIRVSAGGNLQEALTNARPGDVVELEPDATFIGNFVLPRKPASVDFIVVRTAPVERTVPERGRVNPDQAQHFARLRSVNDAPALQTAPGAHHWRIESLDVSGRGAGDVMTLGDGSAAQNSIDLVPHDLVVDRSYIHGDPSAGIKRCIALNSASTTIQNSFIADCKAVGQDAQAICGWNGPGPFRIENNYVEGAGENILFGGADPSIDGLVPSDIVIRHNLITKPVSWRKERWTVKNLLELKNARRVTIEENTLEYNWQGGQSGFAVLFTVRNQDGHCPYCAVGQVAFVSNIVRHSAAGIEILGVDNHAPTQQTRGITIRNNLFDDIDSQNWGGNGYAF
jgi:hypothetical protein